MASTVSSVVQYNGGFPPDMILLTQCYYYSLGTDVSYFLADDAQLEDIYIMVVVLPSTPIL